MSFVATSYEVRVWEEYTSKPSFSQEILAVEFTTTNDFIKSVLPPGFEPADEPKGSIVVGTMESKLCGEFDCAWVSINVKYQGKVGSYMLELIISNDTPVTWGREVWGEIKKTGTARLWRSGDYRYGYAERNGVRLIEIEGKFGDDLPRRQRESLGFEIKAYPNSRGKGLQWEPIVNTMTIVEDDVRRASGTGRIVIRGTASDPLHSIPIVSIQDMEYISGRTDWAVIEETELGVGEAYLPYLVGRHYDDLRAFRVGPEWTRVLNKEAEQPSPVVQRLSTTP